MQAHHLWNGAFSFATSIKTKEKPKMNSDTVPSALFLLYMLIIYMCSYDEPCTYVYGSIPLEGESIIFSRACCLLSSLLPLSKLTTTCTFYC